MRYHQSPACVGADFSDVHLRVVDSIEIGLTYMLFVVYTFVWFSTNIRHLEAELNVIYRSLHHRINQFRRALDTPSFRLVGPVKIDEVYVTAGLKGCERDIWSRLRDFAKRGRGTYEEDKPLIFSLDNLSTSRRYVVLQNPLTRIEIRLYELKERRR